MDGTASLTFPFSAYQMEGAALKGVRKDKNGVVSRVNVNEKKVYLVFTAHYSSDDKGHFENFDGVVPVLNTLKAKGVKGSFFPTGECFRQPRYKAPIKRIIREGHYLSGHSDKHLLLCEGGVSLVSSDSLVETCDEASAYVLKGLGYKLVKPTSGLVTGLDWAAEGETAYRSAGSLVQNIWDFDDKYGLNGAVILVHAMNYPGRAKEDRVYSHLGEIIDGLRARGYSFGTFKEL